MFLLGVIYKNWVDLLFRPSLHPCNLVHWKCWADPLCLYMSEFSRSPNVLPNLGGALPFKSTYSMSELFGAQSLDLLWWWSKLWALGPIGVFIITFGMEWSLGPQQVTIESQIKSRNFPLPILHVNCDFSLEMSCLKGSQNASSHEASFIWPSSLYKTTMASFGGEQVGRPGVLVFCEIFGCMFWFGFVGQDLGPVLVNHPLVC